MNIVANRSANLMIEKKIDFRNHGKTFHGSWVESGVFLGIGQLPREFAEVLLDTIKNEKLYIVYSYRTPIAWFSENSGWTIPDHSYSQTTSRHLSAVKCSIRFDLVAA